MELKRMQIRYTDEEKAFLRSFIPGHFSCEIQSAFEEKFGKCLTYAQIKSFKGNNKICSGVNTTFKKRHVPANKGKKMRAEQYAKCKGTMFKKGHSPQNYRPVGSERVNVDGYIEVKVEDPNKWNLKHRVIWEEHNGEIPKGKLVIFRDNNPLNCNIDNLLLISKGENMKMNNIGACAYKGLEKEVLLNTIRLKNAIKSKLNK
nr:HNH endonuclease signature motif containing protein [uncultured Lachnoanaerobaculum sp.]